jgi:hypothetical protein
VPDDVTIDFFRLLCSTLVSILLSAVIARAFAPPTEKQHSRGLIGRSLQSSKWCYKIRKRVKDPQRSNNRKHRDSHREAGRMKVSSGSRRTSQDTSAYRLLRKDKKRTATSWKLCLVMSMATALGSASVVSSFALQEWRGISPTRSRCSSSSYRPGSTSLLQLHTAVLPNSSNNSTCRKGAPQAQDDGITQLQEKARALLVKSKAKLLAANRQKGGETNEQVSTLPFFASQILQERPADAVRRAEVIKSRDEKTGLITTHGEKMAAMSEKEDWEVRSLSDVFDNELEENADVYAMASRQLAGRDVAASIWNLRKTLKTEDYHIIFDPKNYFIGEDI